MGASFSSGGGAGGTQNPDFGASEHHGNRFSPTGARTGVATLGAGGTVTVSTAEVAAGDVIRLFRQSISGGAGHLYGDTIIAGTSFVLRSTDASDRGGVAWELDH